MAVIRELPASVVNQIAAGEVVERPASVVKELLENSIDAGATRVELAIERGGKDLIRVADDGEGMDADDLPLAFRPHATSKLSNADDLHKVRTLGFRGEALAAIAEISKVVCQTRPRDQETGQEITIEGGVAGPVRSCGIAPGTIIDVRNLFFNVPVRRGFLKSDSTEASHVTEMFTRVALANPRVHLSLRSGGRLVHDLAASTGVKERVATFFGQELAEALLWVESRIEGIHVRGYVSHPSQSRSSNKGQYLFIGQRYVRDRSLSHALSEAYRNLLMVGRQPVAFVFVELPPEDVDVNVHPSKIEVRFRDSNRVYTQLLSTIRQTFLKSDLHARLQVAAEPAKAEAPALAPLASESPRNEPAFGLWPGATDRQEIANWFQPTRPREAEPFASSSGAFRSTSLPLESPAERVRPDPAWMRNLPPLESSNSTRHFDEFRESQVGAEHNLPTLEASVDDESSPSMPSRALQIHDSYLVVETRDGLVVIDQHALHERVLFEELRARLAGGALETQRLLVPLTVELTTLDATALVEHRALLARMGIEVEPLSGGTLLVSGMPVMLGHAAPERILVDLADKLRAAPLDPTADGLLDHLLSTLACKAAVKAGQRLSSNEIDALLERWQGPHQTHHCPHGRPTALVFSKAELERQFGRT